MKNILFIILFFITYTFVGQRIVTKRYESEEIGGFRDIKIHLPKNYDKDSVSNFPITVILNSEKLFDLYTGNAHFFSLNDSAPEQITIGIDMKKTLFLDTGFTKESGELISSSKNFYRFIKNELIPYLEANYKTSPFITIVGEGISGNFITHFLKELTPIFNAYVCINPTFSIDINTQINSYSLKRYEDLDNTFYFYLCKSPFNTPEKNTRINQLNTYFESLKVKNLHYAFDHFKDSPSNISIISEVFPRALTKIFEIYAGITKQEFDKNIKHLSPSGAIAYLENKYLDIEYLFGVNLGIRKNDIIAIEGIVLDKENGDYLKDFGKMILNLHPASPLGNYYLGRYYESGKLYKKALTQYRIGYGKINPSNPNSDKYYENIERLSGKN